MQSGRWAGKLMSAVVTLGVASIWLSAQMPQVAKSKTSEKPPTSSQPLALQSTDKASVQVSAENTKPSISQKDLQWVTPYEEGLKLAAEKDWLKARASFEKAIKVRKSDSNLPTALPISDREQIQWRSGARYSPKFLAAYCAFKLAENSEKPDFRLPTREFESLVKSKQVSVETVYFLSQLYLKQNQGKKADDLWKNQKFNWEVDAEPLSDQEKKAIVDSAPEGTKGPIKIIESTPADRLNEKMAPRVGNKFVPYVQTKFALIVANSETKGQGLQVPSALEDARILQEVLISSAGYSPQNISVVTNADADQIRNGAKTLSERMPQDSTLFFFYTGAATQVDGKDFLLGVNSEVASDTSTGVRKIELYELFLSKGVRVFAFFQVNRPMMDGKVFGTEEPSFGSVSQAQSTIPGESIYTITKEGRSRGIYADALVQVFQELKSNSLPIAEFGWQVFYKMRRGGTATTGGSSRQTPTLPMLLQMGPDTRF